MEDKTGNRSVIMGFQIMRSHPENLVKAFENHRTGPPSREIHITSAQNSARNLSRKNWKGNNKITAQALKRKSWKCPISRSDPIIKR
jgi:hypothetical protein